MITYTIEDLDVLIRMVADLGVEERLRNAFCKTDGTMQDPIFINGREFLAAKFEDVPKYVGAPFDTLVKWRLQIGR